MKFWRVTSPPRNGDYDFTFINGTLSHPHRMPGVKCDVCGETWGGSRILTCHAPECIRRRKASDLWPIPLEQFDALREDAERQLGEKAPRLRPGDKFQPAVLEVPSIPRADFLWGSLGSLVVSSRVREVLLRVCGDSIGAVEVTLGKIGKREARLPAPIPSTGEPEDLIKDAMPLADRSAVGPYFEVVPLGESGAPPGGIPRSICRGCLRPSIDSERRQLVMSEDMWLGAPIFYMATTLMVIVTDDLKSEIARLRPTNIVFESV